jgi:hypothetical protein
MTRGFAALRWAVAASAVAWAGVTPAASFEVDLPVAELDPHYAGGKEGHEYTHAMFELGMRLGAVTTSALRNDTARAKAALKAFRDQQAKVAGMVPSWKAFFKESLLDELDAAVAKPDLDARRRLLARLEGSCTSCHARFMFPVQAHYRWGDFTTVTAQAPDGKAVGLHQLMMDLANSLGGVRADVEAGQFAEAQVAYKLLADRFGMMELICTNCHEQPRQYFIDANVKARLFKIGGLLRKGEKRASEYTPLFNDINERSCLPCHQVHMPAAFLQKRAARP